MDFGWLQRLRVKQPELVPKPKPEAAPVPVIAGPSVLVERLDDDPMGEMIIAELGERYETIALEVDGRRFKVMVDDAFEQDEAVVRLASELDDIDLEWQRHLSWPRSPEPKSKRRNSDTASE